MNVKSSLIPILFLTHLGLTGALAQDSARWSLEKDGYLQWDIQSNDSHLDHIEMSGFHLSAILQYGVVEGHLMAKVHLVFPMLRTIPNDTHASLSYDFDYNDFPKIKIEDEEVDERPGVFRIKGMVTCTSEAPSGLQITHTWFPSTDDPVFIDLVKIRNNGQKTAHVDLPDINLMHTTDKAPGVYGSYVIKALSTRQGSFSIAPGTSLEYGLIFSGRLSTEPDKYISPDYEIKKRQAFVTNTFSNLVFESPDTVLNEAFSLAKLRAVESIYDTKGGLMHGPGGGRYYAAVWANDQAEYANPFFPFLGNLAGNESAINSFRLFARYMNDDFKPIPSSIIAEGTDYWNGAGDRGDMAMIAYGASRFALAYGNEETAQDLWPLITWCLEYCKRKINDQGVVTSDSDELEGRFPSGDANLNTSSLYYDALISAYYLGKELNIDKKEWEDFMQRAKEMKISIEKYFGSTIDGFETYRYYKGNDVLRAWICTPLTVGIFDRSKGTIDALFSKKLWTPDGLASEAGSTTFWDRASLYALRGVLAAGETEKAMTFLEYYSQRRLLGEHVPYPVEAYPEGNQRHLSAESALYCRIITEGLFGIRPTGLRSFTLTPRLPEGWDSMALRNINAFGNSFDIEVNKVMDKLSLRISGGDKMYFESEIGKGESILIEISNSN